MIKNLTAKKQYAFRQSKFTIPVNQKSVLKIYAFT